MEQTEANQRAFGLQMVQKCVQLGFMFGVLFFNRVPDLLIWIHLVFFSRPFGPLYKGLFHVSDSLGLPRLIGLETPFRLKHIVLRERRGASNRDGPPTYKRWPPMASNLIAMVCNLIEEPDRNFVSPRTISPR